ncbi:SIR2 family protein [Bdellovibrio bacteriovorus]|uniref:SIR2 family protein n=1 Tax=Bdellovibrio bacteriovorus TaxID=959 RepID=UPI003AA88AF9
MANLFFLGAGFSKYLHSNMPLMLDLGRGIQEEQYHADLYNEDFKRSKNIESFMSYLNEELPYEKESQYLRKMAAAKDLSRHIWEVISAHDAKYRPTDGNKHRFFCKLLTENSSVITLNYDLLLEKSFESAAKSLPGRTFSQKRSYVMPLTPIISRDGSGMFSTSPPNLKPKIYKLHGSINWFYSGKFSYYGEQIYVREGIDDSHLWADKAPLIIPPTFSKSSYFNNESVRFLWNSAYIELMKCTQLVLFGYSMPESDSVVKTMLENCLNKEAKVVVVNPDESVRVRVARSLGERNYSYFSSGDEFLERYVTGKLLQEGAGI